VLLFFLIPFLVVILILLSIYAARCVHSYKVQPRLLYHPQLSVDVKSRNKTIDHEEITFQTGDGVTISAWYVPYVPVEGAEKPKGVVLFCHGNAGNISQRIDTFNIFRQLGLSTFIFDYRGYGKSAGTPGEKGTYRDADGAWNYLVKEMKVNPGEIIVFGRSLGGGIASYLAQKYQPRALIIESSFTSIPDLASAGRQRAPLKLLIRFKYNTIGRLKNIRCPALIVHSPDDRLIPFSHGQALYEAANHPKKFLRIKGDHPYGFIHSKGIYIKGLRDFVNDLHIGLNGANV
jgi:fermentation-respiration switch protein FrsA (DUF1100 family)